MTTFGERFKQLRNEKKLTQEQLANKFYLNKSSISRYEQDKQVPEISLLQKFAIFFNVSVDYLLGRTDKKNNGNIPVEKLYPEVHDIEKAIKIIMEQPGLMLNGEILTDEDKLILANSIQIGLRLAEERRREREKKKN